MSTRRVVTGHGPDGASRIVEDRTLESIELMLAPGMAFHPVWGTDAPPKLDHAGAVPMSHGYFPPANGVRFVVVTLPPDAEVPGPPADMDPEAFQQMLEQGIADAESKLPGLMTVMELDNPGFFHTSDTIDLIYVVSGRLVLETTAGEPVELSAGDTVIQNGTRHAWRNPGDVAATIVAVILGVDR